MELAFETVHKISIPLEIIDILSFEDIASLRKPVLNSDFQIQYDMIVGKCISSVKKRDPTKVLLDIEELLTIRENLSKSFTEVIERELRILLNKKKGYLTKSLGKNTLSVLLGILGFIPAISTGANITSLIMESPSFLMNLWQRFKSATAFNQYEYYLNSKQELLKQIIERSNISDKSSLLDVVNLLSELISRKITF